MGVELPCPSDTPSVLPELALQLLRLRPPDIVCLPPSIFRIYGPEGFGPLEQTLVPTVLPTRFVQQSHHAASVVTIRVQLTLHDSPPGVATHAHSGLATVSSIHNTTNTIQHSVYLSHISQPRLSLSAPRNITEQPRTTHCVSITYLTTEVCLSVPTHYTTQLTHCNGVCKRPYVADNAINTVSNCCVHFVAQMFYLQASLSCNPRLVSPTMHTHPPTLRSARELKHQTRQENVDHAGGVGIREGKRYK